MRKLLALAGTALVSMAAIAPASATDLYFQMNPNYTGGQGVRQAFIFGAAGSVGTVTSANGFAQAFVLGSNGFTTINVPVSSELAANTVQNNGFKISSTNAISGYFLSRVPFTTDMSYLIDGSKLGTNYVVSTYAGVNGVEQMSVQATVNNTVVTFSPKNAASFNVTLNAGQTYMYTASTNLTGSMIKASAPISVFSGNSCTNIPSNSQACDHIDEQMPSTDQLSTRYLLGKTPRTGPRGDDYRIVATEDNTEVKVNGVVVATLAAGAFYEGRLPGGALIESSAKVLVAQYLVGQSEAGVNTDPAMTIVPGQDQWLNSYVFATPSGTADFPTDFISVVARTDSLGSLMVGGSLANTSSFSMIAGTDFSYGSIDVSSTSGPFSITNANPFELLLSGYDQYDTYFTYGGARFAPGASPPPPPADNVPEPATWMMMLLGFGAIGSAIRSRRSVAAIA